MFAPIYTITNKTLRNIGITDAAREVIDNAPLIPAWEAKFRKEAIERTVHHGTHIEGNKLSLEEAKDILEGGEVVARERDVQEVINLRNSLKFISQLASQELTGEGSCVIAVETIFKLHKLTVDKIVAEDSSGKFRIRQVVVKNAKLDR